MNGAEGLLVWASSQSKSWASDWSILRRLYGSIHSNRSWRCLYGSRRGRHGPVVCCLGTCCVILRVTLYDQLTLEGTGHRPPRRCRSLWDILESSLADCRPYTTAG